jgi:hypothetical protein
MRAAILTRNPYRYTDATIARFTRTTTSVTTVTCRLRRIIVNSGSWSSAFPGKLEDSGLPGNQGNLCSEIKNRGIT